MNIKEYTPKGFANWHEYNERKRWTPQGLQNQAKEDPQRQGQDKIYKKKKQNYSKELKMIQRYKVVDRNGCYYKIFDNKENKAFLIKGKEKLFEFYRKNRNECY